MPEGRTAYETVDVLSVRFHNLSRDEAARAIAEAARSDGKAYVVKPYSEFMPLAHRDERVRDILNGADLCLADGVGILWAAHYLSLPGGTLRALVQLPLSLAAIAFNPKAVRRPLRQAMAGVDLTWRMLARLDEAGASVFLLGGTEEEVRGARERIEARFQRLTVAGAHHGYVTRSAEATDAVVAAIDEARPDVLLVAMGFPRQERWLAANLPRLDVRVVVAEGGSFSFMSGAVPRAPRWLRRIGMEWLYRLARQPWRLRRQLAIPRFVWLVLRERLSRTG
jgi:exopolysaccharide biosynthesis WecB/TagA/CpsF family protein